MFVCMMVEVLGGCGGVESQKEKERLWKKREDAVRSDPERGALQSAERELWEGSPFTLSLSLFLQSCHS